MADAHPERKMKANDEIMVIPTSILCPACKNSQAESLGAVNFYNKNKNEQGDKEIKNEIIGNYHCKACGVTSDVTNPK